MPKIKVVVLLLFTILVFNIDGMCLTAMSDNVINISINGKVINLNNPVIQIDGHIMIPVREVFESIGAMVEWDENLSCVNVAIDGVDLVEFFPNNNGIALRGIRGDSNWKHMGDACKLVNDTTYVSYNVFGEILEINFSFNDHTKTLSIMFDHISTLNGYWIDSAFIESVKQTKSVIKSGNPIQFKISNGNLSEYVFGEGWKTPKTLSISSNGNVIVDKQNTIKKDMKISDTIQYEKDGVLHSLVRYRTMEDMTMELTRSVLEYRYCSGELGMILLRQQLLLDESFQLGHDTVLMEDSYTKILQVYTFELDGQKLKLYNVNDTRKENPKYVLSVLYVD